MDDRLEIIFEDTALGAIFVIARVLKAIIGSQADYALLKPTAPFQPRRRSRAQPVMEVVPGVPPPSNNAIPYGTKLPQAKPSESLSVSLSDTSNRKVHVLRIHESDVHELGSMREPIDGSLVKFSSSLMSC